jgi:hypothetical protein
VGTHTRYFTQTTSGTIRLRWNAIAASGSLTIDNISVREIAGNHASQATSASRPVLKEEGGKHFLLFDGTDDSMATAAIDFSATDEMSVFAGVRKLSDAAQGMVVELSVDTSANAGSFAILAPGTNATANYRWRVGGTTNTNNASASSFAAPITNVLTATGDISGDSAILRADGSETINSTSDQGTGNFGNYALFIGSRNNISFRYNGRLYSLIVRGNTSTAAEITAAETWVNSKTGAF